MDVERATSQTVVSSATEYYCREIRELYEYLVSARQKWGPQCWEGHLQVSEEHLESSEETRCREVLAEHWAYTFVALVHAQERKRKKESGIYIAKHQHQD